uniref:Receptor ligand binding region domain-containing protein n=1 Tax=Phlebotomus papatasi TaxID=29031 RepID=A0A1B0D3A2_PHLPP
MGPEGVGSEGGRRRNGYRGNLCINNNPHILPNVTLALRWNDTRGDTVLATRAITEMICDGVATFFGPEGPCHVEAIVSQSRNIPMISYVILIPCSTSQSPINQLFA